MVTAAIKLRLLLFGRKAMTNLDSILKRRDITLLTKVHRVKAMASHVLLVAKNPFVNAEDIKRHGFDPWVGKIL